MAYILTICYHGDPKPDRLLIFGFDEVTEAVRKAQMMHCDLVMVESLTTAMKGRL